MDRRVLWIGAMCIVLGVLAALAAQLLIMLIDFITNLAFYGRLSIEHASPAGNSLGVGVIFIPMIGGLIVGIMARYGSRAIRGHGIPETMEKVLTDSSRIPARLTLLKPASAAISIGTGGPFGAEGPIIATGGALGSLLGQLQAVTDNERKILLSAGAAAGMAATFGAPVSAVLLAVELLLFELRPRSVIPVALAATAATGVRIAFEGSHAAFGMADVAAPSGAALMLYVLIGVIMGVASVGVTRITYAIEDLFEKLPIHWMWWPVIGTFVVGVCGYFAPRTLGVGYDVITDMLGGSMSIRVVAWLCAMKFISWSISLGSGTSGGTLAPLFMIGGGLGTLLGAGAIAVLPLAGVDLRVAALVGMAALFAGASRALLTAVVFAFEVTLQPTGLLPLLGACSASYMLSALLMRESIMTEKLARRGVRVPSEYSADVLDSLWVRDVASKNVVTLSGGQTIAEVGAWLASGAPGSGHTGFPVIGDEGYLVGILTRRDLLPPSAAVLPAQTELRELIRRPPVIVYEDCTLRDAIDHMVRHDVGRLPVTRRDNPGQVVGIITRSNVLSAHRGRLLDMERGAPSIRMGGKAKRRPPPA
ncbi:MAG TPA: chloride channel protein [Phycisphaerae bacterium]|nr:chloride channel protein [Phycisphaerae bacterium]